MTDPAMIDTETRHDETRHDETRHDEPRRDDIGSKSRTILVLNGPNLNLLGQRQPEIYGAETLADVEARCRREAESHGLTIAFHQSNAEHALIDWIHAYRVGSAGIVLNAGAYTHTSIAILDALNTCEVPVVECHISNVHRREAFRHHSYVSLAATAVMAGFGTHGYVLAVRHLAHLRDARP